MKVIGFPPVIDNDCRIIILGSVPSVKSREAGFFYGNKTNRFWKIMSVVLNEDLTEKSNEEKKETMLKNHIALSDVYSSCEIEGSLDANIKNPEYSDIKTLISGTKIKKIYITSKKAYNDFIKNFGKDFIEKGVKIINLPSPSGANRSVYKTDGELTACWKSILEIK